MWQLIRDLIDAVCTLAVTFAVGRWACYLAYLERGYEAIGGEYCLILITCWTTYKAIHCLTHWREMKIGEMYLIALCDDETSDLDKTEKALDEYEKEHSGLNFVIEHFRDADELFDLVREKEYSPNIIFMDIYMPDKKGKPVSRGIELAKELRNMGYKGKMVFLTSSREHALEAFDVDASQYLVKPVSDHKLFSVLDRFLEETEEERKKYILLRAEGKLVRVSINDIVYCEAQGKMQNLYLADGTKHLLRMTMAEIYGLLSFYQEFVRIGVGFIVNLGYIDSMNAKELNMDNGNRIYLPRGAYKGLREQYFRYYCR